jgi:hypothetical protein
LNQGRRLCLNLCLNLRLNRGLHGWLRGRLWGRRHLTKGHGLHGRLHLRDLHLGLGLRDLDLGLRWHQDLRLRLEGLRPCVDDLWLRLYDLLLHQGRLGLHLNDCLGLRLHRRHRRGLHGGLSLRDLHLGLCLRLSNLGLRCRPGQRLCLHRDLRLRLNHLRLRLEHLRLHLGRLCRHLNNRLGLRLHGRRRHGPHGRLGLRDLHLGLCLRLSNLGLRWHQDLRLCLDILRLHLGRLYLHRNDRLGLRLHRRRCHGLHGGLCLSGLGLGLGLNHGLRLCL